MAAAPARPKRRRPRPGSFERPVNGRLYRGTWLFVALPLLLAAFTVQRPAPLQSTGTPPAFDRTAATTLARDLATHDPNRVPGTAGAIGAADWFSNQLEPYGFEIERQPFTARIPGLGRVRMQNLIARVVGRSPRTIVVAAHRDDSGSGPGAIDNASGTAALIELARVYVATLPNFTIVFLSTDGGAFGSLGAAEFAQHWRSRKDVEAVINLDAIAGSGPPRLQLAADRPRSPAATLVATLAAFVQQETGHQPTRPSALRQLIDLGFPFSLYDQAPFVARGLPAVTLTAAPDRPVDSFRDTHAAIDGTRLLQLGRAAQDTLGALDQGLDLAQGTSSYVYLGARIIPGWSIQLVLIAALLPYFAAVVDLFARCRRRRIAIAPALRSYRSRLGFWLWTGAVFFLFALAGVWPGGAARPPSLESVVAQRWPAAGVVGLLLLAGLGWFVARDRLLPRRPLKVEEELAGYTGALLALCVVALLVVATNPFALLFVLPSLHVWLWLPQVRSESRVVRIAVLLAGFAGFALLLGSFGTRYGLGLDAPWYVAELFALGYAPFPAFLTGLCWLAGAAQLAALVGGRYAPYPDVRERRPRGPIRELVRRVVLAERRRRAATEGRRALEG